MLKLPWTKEELVKAIEFYAPGYESILTLKMKSVEEIHKLASGRYNLTEDQIKWINRG
jgi:hypothetical protein